MKAPLIAICRHRLALDGEGVVTLVAFHGCPLSCRYCLNPHCREPEGLWRRMDARELLDEVMVDDLYFQATGGGVTFGGGEPLLRSRTIAEFCRLCPPGWHVGIETSLAVPQRRLAEVTPYVHRFIIDVKDMNPDIYRRYTGCDNSRVTANLGWLARNVDRRRVVIRLPRIPGYNTPADVACSRRQLEDMGFTLFDCFDYLLP